MGFEVFYLFMYILVEEEDFCGIGFLHHIRRCLKVHLYNEKIILLLWIYTFAIKRIFALYLSQSKSSLTEENEVFFITRKCSVHQIMLHGK